MKKVNDDERKWRVNNRLMTALDGTDSAGRTAQSEVAREELRAALRAIPDAATPEQVLDSRERALNKYLHATGTDKRGRPA